jgi:hypothetical protein
MDVFFPRRCEKHSCNARGKLGRYEDIGILWDTKNEPWKSSYLEMANIFKDLSLKNFILKNFIQTILRQTILRQTIYGKRFTANDFRQTIYNKRFFDKRFEPNVFQRTNFH